MVTWEGSGEGTGEAITRRRTEDMERHDFMDDRVLNDRCTGREAS